MVLFYKFKKILTRLCVLISVFDIKYPYAVATLTYINGTIKLGQLQNSTDCRKCKNTIGHLN